MHIHHVGITVTDIDRSINWYKTHFDAQVVSEYEKDRMRIALIQIGSARLELFSFESDTKTVPEYRKELMGDLHTAGTKHVCLQVENLEETKQKLEEKGAEFATEKDTAFFGGNYIFIKDPDGILIELYQGII